MDLTLVPALISDFFYRYAGIGQQAFCVGNTAVDNIRNAGNVKRPFVQFLKIRLADIKFLCNLFNRPVLLRKLEDFAPQVHQFVVVRNRQDIGRSLGRNLGKQPLHQVVNDFIIIMPTKIRIAN